MKLVHLAVLASFAILMCSGACGHTRVDYRTPVVKVAAEDLHGSVWKSRDTLTEDFRFFKLRSDGQLGHNIHKPSDFHFPGDDTWRLEDGMLILLHAGGEPVEKYSLEHGMAAVLRGRKSSSQREGSYLVILTRIK